MALSVPQYKYGHFWAVENQHGDATIIPCELVSPSNADFADYVKCGEPAQVRHVTGWFCYLSATGDLNATEWAGPFESKAEAREYMRDVYEVDPDTGEALPCLDECTIPILDLEERIEMELRDHCNRLIAHAEQAESEARALRKEAHYIVDMARQERWHELENVLEPDDIESLCEDSPTGLLQNYNIKG